MRATTGTLCLDQACPNLVQADIELLQVGHIRRKQSLDNCRVHLPYVAQSRDDTTEQQNGQIRFVRPCTRILQRLYLVKSRCQAHRTFTVKIAMRIDIATWEREFKLRLQHESI